MATLQAHLEALAGAIRDKLNLMTPRLVPSGGTAGQALTKVSATNYSMQWSTIPTFPDTITKLASDFTNSTVTFNTITGFTYTPPANADFEIEVVLMVQTPTATILPRIGVSIGAGQVYGTVYMNHAAATAITEAPMHGTFTTAATTVQHAAGDLPTAATPYEAFVRIKGKAGATPGAIAIQMASETAGTVCTVRAGSKMVTRTI